MERITSIKALEVLDSRGNPTLEVVVRTNNNVGRAMIPSGASKGIHEAIELRDTKKKRYHGMGVQSAVRNVNTILNRRLKGLSVTDQRLLDQTMIDADKTENKGRLGANSILGVSLAAARCAAESKNKEPYEYLDKKSRVLPIPFSNVINGGRHAGDELRMQEFMIAPVKAKSFSEATQMVSETYHVLKNVIAKKYGKIYTNVGDEGGFAPNIKNPRDALNLISNAISLAGYEDSVAIALDPAASEFFENGAYYPNAKRLSKNQTINYYEDIVKDYHIVSVEDPFDQDDYSSFEIFTKNNPSLQVVGDDLLVTNPKRIRIAVEHKLCNALLLKVNQIGTLSQALDAADLAYKSNWNVMVSHRSGETEDGFISDLAVGLGCGQIKIGAPARSDRTSKYNRLLRIEEELGRRARFAKFTVKRPR
ncbi:phosphopyruvate hydratase [Candidatus Woesearchaeota archaeon]|nr:phosphopyruvate hydratase [Candidatus Woesearchaeota archaeon]